MRALFHDADSGIWRIFLDPVQRLDVADPAAVPNLLSEVERAVRVDGLWATIFVAYEAASGLCPYLQTLPPANLLPVASATLYRSSVDAKSLEEALSILCRDAAPRPCAIGPFRTSSSRDAYLQDVGKIKELLASGECYQVNHTIRLRAPFWGDPLSWFAQKDAAGHGRYAAYLEGDGYALASLSPELFFRRVGRRVTMRPMKGTLPRVPGREIEDAARLRSSEKDRAENLMIVDMVRNDLGRVADHGSVEVSSLFAVETYPTVLQMTSEVSALTNAGIAELMTALFPCASITGAPKRRSMQAIFSLEKEPRGAYTGAIGYLGPNGDALFNVAIRTASFDLARRVAEYGTGGGIVWGSDAESEWEECMAKAAMVKEDGFYAFESLLLEDGAYFLLERHLARLAAACGFFGIGLDLGKARGLLDAVARECGQGSHKVRLVVPAGGTMTVERVPISAVNPVCALSLSPVPIDSENPFLRHKTSAAARPVQSSGGLASDIIFVNERGELTESTRANLVLTIDGARCTPPESAGILPGTFRAELLVSGEIVERTLYPADLPRAESIHLINSVRRWIDCTLA